MDRLGLDLRWSPHPKWRWPTAAICISIIVAAFIARPAKSSSSMFPGFVETAEPPLADRVNGPFRPRPRPTPTPDPQPPVPENDFERHLFPRLETWLDARAKRIEDRAEARMNDALDEITANLDAAIQGADPELMQGAFGAVFVAKLLTFIKTAVKLVILGALGGLIFAYWPWIAGAFAIGIGLLRLWIGSIVANSKR